MKKLSLIKICIIGIILLSLQSHKTIIKPTYTDVWNELNIVGVKWPEIAFAQAVLESGHFKSVVYRNNNNLFGMKLARKRETVANGTKMGYATYENWQASILDYKMYQDYILEKRKIENKNQYIGYIKNTYSESSNYMVLLNKIMKNFSYIVS